MANTFMIEVRLNGRQVYANVYVHTKGQLTYHVNFIGDGLPDFLRDTIILVYKDEELVPEQEGLPQAIVRKIIEGINEHLR